MERMVTALNVLQAKILDPFLLPHPPNVTSYSGGANYSFILPWPGELGKLRGEFESLVNDTATLHKSARIRLADLVMYGRSIIVNEKYHHVTSWLCCFLGKRLMVMWLLATICGLCGALTVVSGMLVLQQMDKTPLTSELNMRACFGLCDPPEPISNNNSISRNHNFHGNFNTAYVYAPFQLPPQVPQPLLTSSDGGVFQHTLQHNYSAMNAMPFHNMLYTVDGREMEPT